jgi:hypothetical protein
MMFLLNDVIFNLSAENFALPPTAGPISKIRMDSITRLGSELFSANPNLAHGKPKVALRLIGLIVTKTPAVNAALFIAPAKGCPPINVTVRYVGLSFDILGDLASQQAKGNLTPPYVDFHVWGRLAA